jgi:hypothetical protein
MRAQEQKFFGSFFKKEYSSVCSAFFSLPLRLLLRGDISWVERICRGHVPC